MSMKKGFLFLAVIGLTAACLPVQSAAPLVKFPFRVTIENMQFNFQEVTGIQQEQQVVEYRGGNSKVYSPVKMPGLKKYGNVTMKKGVVSNTKVVADYLNQIKGGNQGKRSKVTIELLDENGKVAMTWFLSNAWAVKMTKSEAKASDREISIDYIEFAHEGMTIKQ